MSQYYEQKYKNLKAQAGGIVIEKDRAYGSMMGLMVGDALGSRYEFLEKDDATRGVELDMKDGYLDILGGGPFNILPGQITDDSEMALSLLESLAEAHGYDQNMTARKYIKWYESKPVDIGKTINRAIFTRKKATNHEDMIRHSKEMNRTSMSNGSLMRIAPLGIYGTMITDNELHQLVREECDLTHPHEIVKEICYLYCIAIKYLIMRKSKEEVYKMITKYAKLPRTRIVLSDAAKEAEPVFIINELLTEDYIMTDDKQFQGYIGIAFQNAIYELMNGTSFEESLTRVVSRGGDTDTNAAITGGLLGAHYGIAKIDERWQEKVIGADIERYNRTKIDPKKAEEYVEEIIKK